MGWHTSVLLQQDLQETSGLVRGQAVLSTNSCSPKGEICMGMGMSVSPQIWQQFVDLVLFI